MDPEAEVIGLVNETLQRRMNELDASIYQKYSSKFEQIDSKRYKGFQQCLQQKKQVPQCYQRTEKFQFQIDFVKYSKDLQGCVENTMRQFLENKTKQKLKNYHKIDDNFIKNKIQTCVKKYEYEFVKQIQKQLKRISYLI